MEMAHRLWTQSLNLRWYLLSNYFVAGTVLGLSLHFLRLSPALEIEDHV